MVGHHPDPVGELGQEQRLLQRRVAAADHQQLVGAPVERTVAGGAEVHARADQVVLARYPQPPVLRAGRDQHRAAGDLLTGGELHVHSALVGRQPGDLDRGEQLHAVPAGLLDEPVGQLAAADAVREAGVVVDPLGDAGLAAEAGLVHHDRLDALPGGVDGGRQSGRAAADDHQVVRAAARRSAAARAWRRSRRCPVRSGGCRRRSGSSGWSGRRSAPAPHRTGRRRRGRCRSSRRRPGARRGTSWPAGSRGTTGRRTR